MLWLCTDGKVISGLAVSKFGIHPTQVAMLRACHLAVEQDVQSQFWLYSCTVKVCFLGTSLVVNTSFFHSLIF